LNQLGLLLQQNPWIVTIQDLMSWLQQKKGIFTQRLSDPNGFDSDDNSDDDADDDLYSGLSAVHNPQAFFQSAAARGDEVVIDMPGSVDDAAQGEADERTSLLEPRPATGYRAV